MVDLTCYSFPASITSLAFIFPLLPPLTLLAILLRNVIELANFPFLFFSIQLLIPSFIWLDGSKYLKECLIKHNYITRL